MRTHVFSRVYLPRLGVSILNGYLKNAGYDVEVIYQQFQNFNLEYLKGFDLVGLSSLTSTVTEAYRIGQFLKEAGVVVVMGGPHASAMTEEALEYCDYVARGEGENSFLGLLSALNNGGDVSGIAGISYKTDDGVTHNQSDIELVNMETLPANDFSACKGFKGAGEYPPIVMFSRGCPFDCNFCSVTTTFGKKYRFKRTEQVIEDLEPFLDRSVCFIDDNFAAAPKKTKALLRAMIDQDKVPLRYSCQVRINAAQDEELMELMRRTQMRIGYVGLESVSPETLKQYKKGQTLDQISDAIATFRKYGIGLHGMFVLGGENDTRKTIKDTVDFALETGLDTIQLCALTPFPGTAIYDEMTRSGRVLHSVWDHYDGHHVTIRPKQMTPYELQQGIVEETERFYSLRNIARLSWQKRWRLKYRLGGRYLIRKWASENAEYIDSLKKFG